MLTNLIAQKLMESVGCFGIRGGDAEASAARHVLVSKRQRIFSFLHPRDSRRHLAVRGERFAEISARKVGRNLLQVRANLANGRFSGGIVRHHFDRAAGFVQPEMMRRGLLVEGHRGGAAPLQVGILLYLGEMFLVGHSWWHRMLRERRRPGTREDDRKHGELTNVCWHVVDAKAWSRLQSQDRLTIRYGSYTLDW